MVPGSWVRPLGDGEVMIDKLTIKRHPVLDDRYVISDGVVETNNATFNDLMAAIEELTGWRFVDWIGRRGVHSEYH